MFEACCERDVEKVKELLANGADPTVENNWALTKTSFRYASYFGIAEIVEIFLRDGRVNPVDDSNFVIDMASRNGHVGVIALLLQDGRVEPTDYAIIHAETDEIREMLIAYKYRVVSESEK